MAEEDIDEVHRVVYRAVLPVLVFFGIVANALCLLVLTRPALRAMKVNWYFIALASSDALVCVFHIPVITTITGCTFSSYSEAYYFTHFGWTLIGVFQTFGVYIIVWLSFDRFIAVWMYEIYPKIQQHNNVKRNRLLVSAAASVILHLVYMVHTNLTCDSQVEGDEACEHGHWISISGYQYQFSYVWHKVYRVIYGLFIRWLPICLLFIFNASLILGVIQGRVNLPGCSQTPGRTGERKLVIITVAITACYVLFTFPIMVYITGYAKAVDDRCSGNHPKEALRAVGNTLQLFEHVIHIAIYVGLNPRFRRELMSLLGLESVEEGGEGLGEGGRVKSQYEVDKRSVETGQRYGQESSRASPSLYSTTPSRPTLSQDLDASTNNITAL